MVFQVLEIFYLNYFQMKNQIKSFKTIKSQVSRNFFYAKAPWRKIFAFPSLRKNMHRAPFAAASPCQHTDYRDSLEPKAVFGWTQIWRVELFYTTLRTVLRKVSIVGLWLMVA